MDKFQKHYGKMHKETTNWTFILRDDYYSISSFLIECEKKPYTSAFQAMERFLNSPLIECNGLCGVPEAVLENFFRLVRLYITTEPHQKDRLTSFLNIKVVTTWTGTQVRAYRIELLQSSFSNDNDRKIKADRRPEA